jgi:hypothetical protein
MFKKFVKKTFKNLKKVLKNPGRALKKGLGKIGEAFGKLGPIGTIALSLMLPGLGAAWTTFGNFAAGVSGPMGAVLQGIATAGNAVGSVYSSITDLVSGTLNKVTGGTFARPGTAGYQAGGSDKLSNWVGTKLDDFRMKAGLPTANITPDSAMADAAKLGEDLANKGFSAPSTITDADVTLKDGNSLLKKSSTSITTPKELSSSDIDISFNVDKPTLASVKSQGQTTDIITGFKKDIQFVGNNELEIQSLTPEYTTVFTSDLTKDQIYQNNRLLKFQTNLEASNRRILEGVEGNADFSNFDLLQQQTKKLATVAGGAAAIQTGQTEEESGGYTPIQITDLPTDVSTSNDYTKAYGTQFAQAGYTGMPSMEGFAQAGFYGGDPYSFSQVLRNNKVAVPTATVRI